MKPSLSTLLPTKPFRHGVCSATLAVSLGVVWPAWAATPFTVNGNGTVTDASTSLVWDQCPYGLTGAACDTGSVFYGDWPTALTKAVEANAASHKGFADWRVPNKNELESIVKLDTIGLPSIDTSVFPGTPLDWFWTSTTYAPSPSFAWIVSFVDGDIYAAKKANSNPNFNYVRLVRSGQSLAPFDLLGSLPDTTPPVTTAGPTVTSGPTQSTAGLSVTINEAGTGYWLLVPSAAAAPTPVQVTAGINYGAVAVVAGGSTAMPAATPAGINLTGLTAASAYTLYFVAKDTANNLQAAVSSVAVSTVALIGQTITGFNPASPVVFGAAPVTLSATGGASGQPVLFATTSAGTICTVSGTTVTFTGVGVCHLTANQAGAGSYADAPEVSTSITVNASRSVSGSSPAGGSITAAFSGGNASCSYASTAFTTASAPPGITLLHGAFGFTTTDCGAGASLSFTITYPQTLPAGTLVYKYGPTTADVSDHWYVLSNPSVSISGNQITFTVTDNDSGDSNPAVGFITDPVGVGLPALAGGATSIPTLSEWGAILLSALLGLSCLARVRQQNS